MAFTCVLWGSAQRKARVTYSVEKQQPLTAGKSMQQIRLNCLLKKKKKQASGEQIVRELKQEEEEEVAEAGMEEVLVLRHRGKTELIPARVWSWRCPPANRHESVWRSTPALEIKKINKRRGSIKKQCGFRKEEKDDIVPNMVLFV